MSFLSVNLYGHPSGATFDPAEVVLRFEQLIEGVEADPGDQLSAQTDRARSLFGPTPDAAARSVIETLDRNARTQGPAYSFSIPCPGGPVRGVVKRHMVQLSFGDGADAATVERLRGVLRSMVPENSGVEVEQE